MSIVTQINMMSLFALYGSEQLIQPIPPANSVMQYSSREFGASNNDLERSDSQNGSACEPNQLSCQLLTHVVNLDHPLNCNRFQGIANLVKHHDQPTRQSLFNCSTRPLAIQDKIAMLARTWTQGGPPKNPWTYATRSWSKSECIVEALESR